MKLFHFTARHHVPAIQRDGLSLGGLVRPLGSGLTVERGWQWLTDFGDFTAQAWHRGPVQHHDGGPPCDRTEVRLAVAIPVHARANLVPWRTLARSFPDDFVEWFDPPGSGGEHWFVYRGRIPPGWLRDVLSRPGVSVAA